MKISVVKDHPEVSLPTYETAGAAGADLRAWFPPEADTRETVIGPGERALLQTGLRVAIPAGYEIQVRPRSGLALKQGITVLNSPGTIDSDYRGPLCVMLVNHGKDAVTVRNGDRVAQMVVAPVVQAGFDEVSDLDRTARGEGGFGSTGGISAWPDGVWRHRKGGIYTIVGMLGEDVVYVAHSDRRRWQRPLAEFVDGRFSRAAEAPLGREDIGIEIVGTMIRVLAGDVLVTAAEAGIERA